jgi:hypothetical protein
VNPNQTHLAKILFWFFLSLILAGLAVVAEGQEDAPTKHFPRIDWKQASKSGILEDSIARGVDVYSTHLALSRGAHEMFLPAAIANHSAALAGYQLATIETEHLLSHQLVKRHHPNLARSIPWIDAAQDGFWAIRNFSQHGTPAAKFSGRPLPSRGTN